MVAQTCLVVLEMEWGEQIEIYWEKWQELVMDWMRGIKDDLWDFIANKWVALKLFTEVEITNRGKDTFFWKWKSGVP